MTVQVIILHIYFFIFAFFFHEINFKALAVYFWFKSKLEIIHIIPEQIKLLISYCVGSWC